LCYFYVIDDFTWGEEFNVSIPPSGDWGKLRLPWQLPDGNCFLMASGFVLSKCSLAKPNCQAGALAPQAVSTRDGALCATVPGL
jgi:hypothetical protein